MKRVLFVDDEPMILDAMEHLMGNMRPDWDMRFARSGAEALLLLDEKPADVVVSDMRMPQMTGAQLLREIKQRHPKTVRIILSGFSDVQVVMQCIEGTHQFLSKPCNCETLRNIISRAFETESWIDGDDLKAVIGSLSNLPTLPAIYFDILNELQSPSGSLQSVGELIGRDAALTAKILQLVNSAFFGLRRHISDSTEAIIHLGMETIRSLVVGLHIFSELKTTREAAVISQKLWKHSLATATRARNIARGERMSRELADAAFTGGLLHDIGRLVLLSNFPDKYVKMMRQAKEEQITLGAAEQAVFGADHATVGGYLLGIWGLPVSLVEAAVFHHAPRKSSTRIVTPLSVVHAANVFEQGDIAELPERLLTQLDEDYLTEVGILERAHIWRHALPVH